MIIYFQHSTFLPRRVEKCQFWLSFLFAYNATMDGSIKFQLIFFKRSCVEDYSVKRFISIGPVFVEISVFKCSSNHCNSCWSHCKCQEYLAIEVFNLNLNRNFGSSRHYCPPALLGKIKFYQNDQLEIQAFDQINKFLVTFSKYYFVLLDH